MSAALDAAVRTSAVLLAGLALAGVLQRRSAAVRHGVLAVTLLAAGLVVPLSLAVPTWTILVPAAARVEPAPAPRPSAPPRAAVVTVPVTASAVERTQPPVAALLWAGGFATGLAMLLAGLIRLKRLAARSRAVTDQRWIAAARATAAAHGLRVPIVLMEGDSPFAIATWGLRPARVMLPPGASDWTDARIRTVLAHELAHVARADWAVQIAAQVVLAALWFQPLAWLACRRLRQESERACDDAVIVRAGAAAEYASHLVALARECRRPAWPLGSSFSPGPPALPMAHPSAFERRIAAMLNPRVDRRPLSRRTAAALACALAAVTLTSAALRAVQAPPGALTGTVYDPTGAVVPGVTVTLEDPQQRTAQAATDASGRFSFAGIGSGHYVLSAELPGFRKLRDEFDLKTARDWDRAVTLQLGAVQETISVRASRVASGGAPTTPFRVRVGGNIRVPLKTFDVHPEYPVSMRVAGREGQVPIEALIAADGSVSSVRVLSAQVHPDFAIAAADAVRQWRFTPTLLNGQAVEVVMTVTVNFSLSD